MERKENDRIAKRVYVGESAGSQSMDRFGCQASKKRVQDRSEWQGFVRGSAWGVAQGMNP